MSFAKVTGGKGLNLLVPLRRTHDWPHVAEFAAGGRKRSSGRPPIAIRRCCRSALWQGARSLSTTCAKPCWQGPPSIVALYSTRSGEGARVAAPVSWRELGRHRSARSFQRPIDALSVARAISRSGAARKRRIVQTITQKMPSATNRPGVRDSVLPVAFLPPADAPTNGVD